MKKTILIVDDTPINIDILQELLCDYNCKAAINGKIALKIAEKVQPDLILLDVMMPVMDGFEANRKLKENPATANIPVLFITAMSDEEQEDESNQLTPDNHIRKPFDFAQVITLVEKNLI